MKKLNYDKLLEIAMKTNTLKTIDDLTDEDSLSNEDLVYYVGEKISNYNTYNIGDIVFISKYKYKNNKIGKDHLFVIIGEDNYAIPINYFCMIISSRLNKLKFKENLFIKKDDTNKLNKDSIIKTDYVYKINKDNIEFCIGKVPLKFVEECYKLYLNSKEIVYE